MAGYRHLFAICFLSSSSLVMMPEAFAADQDPVANPRIAVPVDGHASPVPTADVAGGTPAPSRVIKVSRDPSGEIHISLSVNSPEGTSSRIWRARSLPDLKSNQPEGYEIFVEFLKGEVANRARQRGLARERQKREQEGLPVEDHPDGLIQEIPAQPEAERVAQPEPIRIREIARLPVVVPQSSAAWPSSESQPRQIQADIHGGRIDIRDDVDGTIAISWQPRTNTAGRERFWVGNSIEKLKESDSELAQWYWQLTGGPPTVQPTDPNTLISNSGLSVIGLPPPPPPVDPADVEAIVPVTEVGGLPLAPPPIVIPQEDLPLKAPVP